MLILHHTNTYEGMIMGWNGIKKHFNSVKDYANQELSYGEKDQWSLLDRSFRGNVIYSLITNGVDKMITVDKVKVVDGYWMHKSFSEKDHPYEYECPKKYIKQSTIMTEFAIAYKAECLKVQNEKKIKKDYISSLGMGDTVETTQGKALFHSLHKASQFIGRDVESGKLYRYNISSIKIQL